MNKTTNKSIKKESNKVGIRVSPYASVCDNPWCVARKDGKSKSSHVLRRQAKQNINKSEE